MLLVSIGSQIIIKGYIMRTINLSQYLDNGLIRTTMHLRERFQMRNTTWQSIEELITDLEDYALYVRLYENQNNDLEMNIELEDAEGQLWGLGFRIDNGYLYITTLLAPHMMRNDIRYQRVVERLEIV